MTAPIPAIRPGWKYSLSLSNVVLGFAVKANDGKTDTDVRKESAVMHNTKARIQLMKVPIGTASRIRTKKIIRAWMAFSSQRPHCRLVRQLRTTLYITTGKSAGDTVWSFVIHSWFKARPPPPLKN